MKGKRRWTVVALVIAAAGVAASGVVASQFSPYDDSDRLATAVSEAPLVRVADIAGVNGAPAHGVFVQKTATGHVCLWDAPSAESRQRQGGCNRADDPLGSRALSVSFAYDGGPAVSDVKDARLIGLVADRVAQVQVAMSDGSRRTMRLHETRIDDVDYRAFGHRFSPGELRRGAEPTAVVALAADGQEIDRQETGFVK